MSENSESRNIKWEFHCICIVRFCTSKHFTSSLLVYYAARIRNAGDHSSWQLNGGQHFSFTYQAGVYVLAIIIMNFSLLQPDSAVRSVTPSGKKVNIALSRNSAQGSNKDHTL
jgi:hypothetical protein